MSAERLERTQASMLWAAWADALGFISELTSAENLRRRTRGRELKQPMAWSRVVGGRGGVRAELPEGCYSDDTQLRLATARAISSRGFDVEAFSRVELTVWPSYALGGGRASRAAATAMSKPRANWASNFYNGWQNAGGNGAAMRIQPHVYAACDLRSFEHLDDVIRNSVVTHGHPRGIVGAVFHAVCLTFALDTGRVPQSEDFGSLLEVVRDARVAFHRQPELSAYWLPQWERLADTHFAAAWDATVDEIADLLRAAADPLRRLRATAQDRFAALEVYERLVSELRLDDDSSRGSATATTVAALVLAAAFPDHPAQGAQIAAMRLDTDTDTIATMAAALVGAASPRDLISPVLDRDYLASEARRLHGIASRREERSFPYPDLLSWNPPTTAVDAAGMVGGNLTLAGIGKLSVTGEPIRNRDAAWVWTTTRFGQSLLIKHRLDLRELPLESRPAPAQPRLASAQAADTRQAPRSDAPTPRSSGLPVSQATLFDAQDQEEVPATVSGWLQWLERRGYQDADIGRAIRALLLGGAHPDFEAFAAELAGRLHPRR